MMISNFTNINKAKESLIKQWWSAIPPVFMKRTTTSDWRQKRDHDIGHLCSGLGQAQTCGVLKALNYFQSFDFERTSWWRLFQKCVAHTKLDIYVFIKLVNVILILPSCICNDNIGIYKWKKTCTDSPPVWHQHNRLFTTKT